MPFMPFSRYEDTILIELSDVSKISTLHYQGGAVIKVLAGVDLVVQPGGCVVPTGASGAG